MPLDSCQRARGALAGLLIGDALAMPVHWYYDRAALAREYGRVEDFVAPRNPHTGSILWRSSYVAANPRGEILHEQARYWGQPGIHYHQFLAAGENTLTAKLARLALASIARHGGYRADAYLDEYIAFLSTPGSHRDTYLEECHRGFFTNYAQGRPPRQCAVQEKHIGGLTPMLAVALAYHDAPGEGIEHALEHLSLTHAGRKMESGGRLVLEILFAVLGGQPLREVLEQRLERQDHAYLGHPFRAWLREEDAQVIGPRVSSACYLEDSIPAVLYLALKYHDRPSAGLIANTNLGGDNVHRGSVLGALLGAEHGPEAWPEKWRTGLETPIPDVCQRHPRFASFTHQQ